MPRNAEQKIKLLVLYNLLQRFTDEEHPMTTLEIVEELNKNGITETRQTVYEDIEVLNQFGYEVICVKGRNNRYFVGDRTFERPEIQIMLNAIGAAKFLTDKKTSLLTEKVAELLRTTQAEQIKGILPVENNKNGNDYIYYNIDAITSAILEKKKLSFLYFDYGCHGERLYRKDKKRYVVNPLGNECKRYELEPFSFKYIDLRPIIRKETKEPVSSLGVEYMKWCNALPCNSHRSDADAANTLAIARALCRKKGCSFASLIAEYSNYIGETHDYIMGNKTQGKRDQRIKRSESYRELSEDKEDWLLKGSKNFVMFIRFLDYVKVSEEAPQVFANKKISISLNFEMYNFKNMLKLVQLITNAGGEYHKKASESDIFVNYDLLLEDGTVRTCSKSEYVKQAIAEGASITEISFDDLLSQLGISQASLKLMPDIDIGYLDDKKYSRK